MGLTATERRAREIQVIGLMREVFGSPAGFRGLDDDAAVVDITGNCPTSLVMTVDAQTSVKDFNLTDDPYLIGRYCCAASASDLAAMGATPKYLLVDMLLPFHLDDTFFRRLAEGMMAFAAGCGAIILGGDTERAGSLSRISVTSVGFCGGWQPLLRSGACPGDRVCLVGLAGRPLAESILNDGRINLAAFLEDIGFAHIGTALGQSELADAAMDTSDGIFVTLDSMCQASGIGCLIDSRSVPLHPRARLALDMGLVRIDQLLASTLSDHLLVMSVPSVNVNKLKELLGAAGALLTNIGVFVNERSVRATLDDQLIDLGTVVEPDIAE